MSDPTKFNSVVSFIWSIADLLNGAFQKSQMQAIILPFTVLRRLDYALLPTKHSVLEKEAELVDAGLDSREARHGQLCRASGYSFYNTSKFTYDSLLHDDANLARNLRQYILGFSDNVGKIFTAFEFDHTINQLDKAGLLYHLMERFNEKSKVDLRPDALTNHQMGYVFEHLLRKFNESLNANPGEHFTPREIIRLLVELVLLLDPELANGKGVARTLNDCCCGTGGILSIGKEQILKINPKAVVHLFGQELNPSTWATARADFLILEPAGKDAENIKLGSPLSNDQLSHLTFDYQFLNPPYGMEWSKDYDPVTEEAARGFSSRFGAGLPRKSDGQLLFLQHCIAHMHDPKEAGSYIGIILNGSPLFSGDAGSGESEIRRWILENDWLHAIVALPQQIFYNTQIATYIWLLSNRKRPEDKGKVMLVDASGQDFWAEMSKSLGNKRREITDRHKQSILEMVKNRTEGPFLKIFDTTDFGFRQIRVERPLRLRFEVTADGLTSLEEQAAFKNLAVSKKKDPAEKQQEQKEGAALQGNIRTALGLLTGKSFTNREEWERSLQVALKKAGIKLKAPVLKSISAAFGERDENADLCTDDNGNPEPDKDLTDYENVPLKECVETYFAREVLPHVPDAWVNKTHCDAKDGLPGVIGYEIPFNRHFYKYEAPQPLEEIQASLKVMEGEILSLLREVIS
jgi:type I restriction enzyme M protein